MSNEVECIEESEEEKRNIEIKKIENEKEKIIEDNNTVKETELKISTKRKWEEANSCPICLSPWSSTGDHQIASLKCGHLFGYSCILKWLRAKSTKESRCPCCNSHAIVRNVRKLYACNIKVEDNSQYESVKKEKDEMNNYCKMLNKEKTHYQVYSRIANGQLLSQKNMINDYKQQLKKLKKKNSNKNKYQFNTTFVIDNNLRSSRILSFNSIEKVLYASKSLNPQNFGIVKIDLQKNSVGEYYQLHEKMIKDIHCNPVNGNILSCSIDKTIQIFSNKTKDIDICIPLDSACWSCCWSTYNENQIFAGLSNNSILMYDIRNLSSYCSKLNGGSNKPIHSLIYVNNLNNGNSSEKVSSGILGASLDSIFYHDQKTIEDGSVTNNDSLPKLTYQQQNNTKLKDQQSNQTKCSCISLSFDPLTQQVLSTWRSSSSSGLLTNYNIDYLNYSPSNQINTSTTIQSPTKSGNFMSSYDYMRELENKPKYPVSFERIQEIYGYSGQKFITRNTIFSEYKQSESLIDESAIENNELETFVCASDEGSCSSIIWKCHRDNKFSLAYHSLYQELPSENKSVILDIKHCPLTNTHSNILACLTGDQVFFYKK